MSDRPFDAQGSFNEAKGKVIEAIRSYFPEGAFEGKKQKLVIKSVDVDDKLEFDDFAGQQEVREKDGTWAVPIKAHLQLIDKATGKVVDDKKMVIAQLPKLTPRFSYIIEGKERQVDHQSLLRQGIYTRIGDDGILEAKLNTRDSGERVKMFGITYDPQSRRFMMDVDDTEVPALAMLKALGASDDAIRKAWGGTIFADNQVPDKEAARKILSVTEKMAKRYPEKVVKGDTQATLRNVFGSLFLDPEVTEMVVGQRLNNVTDTAILAATSKMLDINRGDDAPTGYDDLRFKKIRHTSDFLYDRIVESKRQVLPKLLNNIDRQATIDRIWHRDLFDKPVRSFFQTAQLSTLADQTNPLGMLTGHTKHTIMGEHGIGDSHQVSDESKSVHPSSFGFIDPLHTPECFTGDTEVFTRRGWVRFDEVKDHDEFACRVGDELSFHPAEHVTRSHYKGEMIAVRSPRVSFVVTPNHRVYFRPIDGVHWRVEPAENIYGKAIRIRSDHAPYQGNRKTWVALQPSSHRNNKTKIVEKVQAIDWAALVGWIISEGHVCCDVARSQYHVRIAQTKPHGREKIQKLLERLPFTWHANKEGFGLSTRQLAEIFHPLGLSYEKYIPEEMFSLGIEAREALLDALLAGDGRTESRRATGVTYAQKVYTTSSPRLANDVERLAVGLGYATTHHTYNDRRKATYKTMHEVRLLRHTQWEIDPRRERSAATYSKIPHDGLVYCATVPGGLLLVRTGGPSHVGFWSGNSDRTGIALQIPMGTWKRGDTLVTRAINAKTGRLEIVDVKTLSSKNLGFPDDFKLIPGKPPIPRKEVVPVIDGKGETREVKKGAVDYVLPTHSHLFSHTTNTIPFLGTNNGNRVGYATQQAHQALALAEKEEPLVQSQTPGESMLNPAKAVVDDTFEGLVGMMSSHRSKAEGTVREVTKTHITVLTPDKKLVKHSLYNHFPTNNKKGMLHSEPIVKVGDTVRINQTLADTNFTKNGKIALGRNLTVGYMTAEGYNFEDGLPVSESAAKALGSVHLYKEELPLNDRTHLGTKKFLAHAPTRYKHEQLGHLDEEGVAKVGSRVKPGDPLLLSVTKNVVSNEAEGIARVSKGLVQDWKPNPIDWEGSTEGEVVKVIRLGKKIKVHVKAIEPLEVGDKVVGRYGNKSIVTKILPDDQMPYFTDPLTGEKKRIQVMFNPLAVPGRINAGQLLETSASWIAKKTGQPYKVRSFDPNIPDYTAKVEEDLKKHGLKAAHMTYDPSGTPLGEVHVGDQYFYKLDHQISKKIQARGAGIGNPYDGNKAPTTGGGRLGALGNYAMLAHGAVANLREMQTMKSSHDDEVWRAVQLGDPIPTPKPSYAYEKFEAYMKGMGVNIAKQGHQLVLEPLTDKQVEQFSNGEVKKPGLMIRGKDMASEKDGLFDPRIFGKDGGGLQGTRWGHITLDTPMPNPLFEKAILKLLDLKEAEFQDVLAGRLALQGKTGPQAIEAALKGIKVPAMLSSVREQLKTAPDGKVDLLHTKLRYLENLHKMKVSPEDAYLRKKVPVLPPMMRPVSELPDGSLNTDDLNGIYRGLGLANQQLRDLDPDLKKLPEETGKLHTSLYDAMKALTGVGTVPGYHFSKRDNLRGLMNKIEGNTPKTGFFQSQVLSRKQDMSMRSTIIPNQEIQLDEIALPKAGLVSMMGPHLTLELRRAGLTTLQAKEAIKKGEKIVDQALERVMAEVPVLAKRDPVLHKFGIQAFRPRLAKGQAIEIHPLVTGGYNADFDGNCVLGDSKIVLTTKHSPAIKECVALTQEELEMKFGKQSRILSKLDDTLVVELEIQYLPYDKESFVLDKNGARVHPVSYPFSVRSYDSITAEATFEEVTHVTVEEDCPVFRVETKRGWVVDASGNESLACFDHTNGGLHRAPASDESVGKFCAILPPLDEATLRLLPSMGLTTFDEGWALGSFVSDGFFMGGKTVDYAKLDDAQRARMSAIVSPRGCKTYRHDNTTGFGDGAKDHYSGVSQVWIDLFSACYAKTEVTGRAALRKQLPEEWRAYTQEAKWGLLSGLLDGDGSVSKNQNGRYMVQLSTSSEFLVRDAIDLCRALGIRATSTEYRSSSTDSRAFMLSLSTVDVQLFGLQIRLLNPRKKEVLSELLQADLCDDGDQIPLTKEELRAIISLEGLEAKQKKSFQTILSAKKGSWSVQRDVLLSVFHRLPKKESFPASVVARMTSAVRWDKVISVTSLGSKQVFDLCIPTTKVFAVNDGLVVWDTMGVFAPATKEGIEEAKKMLPSNNLFNPTYGSVMYAPTNEAQTGIWLFTKASKKVAVTVATAEEAKKLYDTKKIRFDDEITVGGRPTTVGRLILDDALPPTMKGKIAWGGKPLAKKEVEKLLVEIAKNNPAHYSKFLQEIKNNGNRAIYQKGTSISLADIKVNKTLRDKFFVDLQKKEKSIRENPSLSKKEREEKVVELYRSNLDKFDDVMKEDLRKRGSSLMTFVDSGGTSKWIQIKQLTAAPVMFEDSQGKPVPVPVLKSYSEGLKIADYLTAAHGVRMGTLSKSQGTSEPGALSKQVINVTMGTLVESDDCGTSTGLSMGVDDDDVLDRYLAHDVKNSAGKVIAAKGSLLNAALRDRIKSEGVTAVSVRSPLRCSLGQGVCAKCVGLADTGRPYSIGTNIGVISAQALGEPTTQMSMKQFHSGGALTSKKVSLKTGPFQVAKTLLVMPKRMKESASLAPAEGAISKITKDPAGGFRVEVSPPSGPKQDIYVPTLLPSVVVGKRVAAGDPLSPGIVNPHQLLPLAGVDTVRTSMTNQLSSAYGNIRKRHVELVVRHMTDLAEVIDPGDSDDVVRGDTVSSSKIAELNRGLVGKRPIKFRPVLKGVKQMPLAMREDWAARMNFDHLKQTVMEGTLRGWKSDIHGRNPVAGYMYGAEFGRPPLGSKSPY